MSYYSLSSYGNLPLTETVTGCGSLLNLFKVRQDSTNQVWGIGQQTPSLWTLVLVPEEIAPGPLLDQQLWFFDGPTNTLRNYWVYSNLGPNLAVSANAAIDHSPLLATSPVGLVGTLVPDLNPPNVDFSASRIRFGTTTATGPGNISTTPSIGIVLNDVVYGPGNTVTNLITTVTTTGESPSAWWQIRNYPYDMYDINYETILTNRQQYDQLDVILRSPYIGGIFDLAQLTLIVDDTGPTVTKTGTSANSIAPQLDFAFSFLGSTYTATTPAASISPTQLAIDLQNSIQAQHPGSVYTLDGKAHTNFFQALVPGNPNNPAGGYFLTPGTYNLIQLEDSINQAFRDSGVIGPHDGMVTFDPDPATGTITMSFTNNIPSVWFFTLIGRAGPFIGRIPTVFHDVLSITGQATDCGSLPGQRNFVTSLGDMYTPLSSAVTFDPNSLFFSVTWSTQLVGADPPFFVDAGSTIQEQIGFVPPVSGDNSFLWSSSQPSDVSNMNTIFNLEFLPDDQTFFIKQVHFNNLNQFQGIYYLFSTVTNGAYTIDATANAQGRFQDPRFMWQRFNCPFLQDGSVTQTPPRTFDLWGQTYPPQVIPGKGIVQTVDFPRMVNSQHNSLLYNVGSNLFVNFAAADPLLLGAVPQSYQATMTSYHTIVDTIELKKSPLIQQWFDHRSQPNLARCCLPTIDNEQKEAVIEFCSLTNLIPNDPDTCDLTVSILCQKQQNACAPICACFNAPNSGIPGVSVSSNLCFYGPCWTPNAYHLPIFDFVGTCEQSTCLQAVEFLLRPVLFKGVVTDTCAGFSDLVPVVIDPKYLSILASTSLGGQTLSPEPILPSDPNAGVQDVQSPTNADIAMGVLLATVFVMLLLLVLAMMFRRRMNGTKAK